MPAVKTSFFIRAPNRKERRAAFGVANQNTSRAAFNDDHGCLELMFAHHFALSRTPIQHAGITMARDGQLV